MRELLTVFTVLFAGLAAGGGFVVLEGFFRDKLQDLFDDVNYFIFFFLVSGYFLYALGEVSFYLMKVIAGDESVIGIADVYWFAGAILIVVSFLALLITSWKDERSSSRLFGTLGVIFLALAVVTYVLFGFIPESDSLSFFNYFYPLMSALIVAISFSVLFFFEQHEHFSMPLFMFFLASVGILLGDVLFAISSAQGIYLTGGLGSVTDIFYTLGYGLSLLAFVMFRFRMHQAAEL